MSMLNTLDNSNKNMMILNTNNNNNNDNYSQNIPNLKVVTLNIW